MERNDKINLEQLMFYINNVAGYKYSDVLKLLSNLSFNDSLDLVLKNNLILGGDKISFGNDLVIQGLSGNNELSFGRVDCNSRFFYSFDDDKLCISDFDKNLKYVLTSEDINLDNWHTLSNAFDIDSSSVSAKELLTLQKGLKSYSPVFSLDNSNIGIFKVFVGTYDEKSKNWKDLTHDGYFISTRFNECKQSEGSADIDINGLYFQTSGLVYEVFKDIEIDMGQTYCSIDRQNNVMYFDNKRVDSTSAYYKFIESMNQMLSLDMYMNMNKTEDVTTRGFSQNENVISFCWICGQFFPKYLIFKTETNLLGKDYDVYFSLNFDENNLADFDPTTYENMNRCYRFKMTLLDKSDSTKISYTFNTAQVINSLSLFWTEPYIEFWLTEDALSDKKKHTAEELALFDDFVHRMMTTKFEYTLICCMMNIGIAPREDI